MVFFTKWYKDEGETFGINMNVVEPFHQCFARFHKLG